MPMLTAIRTMAVLLALAFSSPALCDAPMAETMPSGPVLAYGDRNAACLEWSDGCVVCAREADGPHCSTPGIACQPTETACKRKMK
jgi:hypothetical protein